ncbi:CvpA family protein [Patescibacteria group bacterium]|nr:CvpA family protein [Patescibacteria group bacterium]
MFGLIDIVLIAIVALVVLFGWRYGFIQTLGNLIGLVVGIFLAGHLLVFLEERFSILQQPHVAIIAFIVLIFLISRVVGWIVKLLDELYKIISIIPGLTSINKLLGAALGFIEGGLILVTIAYFAQNFLPESGFRETLVSSPIIQWLSWTMDIAQWLFPSITI